MIGRWRISRERAASGFGISCAAARVPFRFICIEKTDFQADAEARSMMQASVS